MALDQRRLLLFGGAALLRILLFVLVPSLPDLLTGRAELSTPVTNFKRCKAAQLPMHLEDLQLTGLEVQEGVFLYTHNVSPYDGGAFHEVISLLISTWFRSKC